MKAKVESRKNKIYRIEKRIIDVLLSSLSLVVMSPVFIVISIGVKLSGSGPVIYQQWRVGFAGQLFTYRKFRTMTSDASELGTGPIFKLKNDPRITPFGRFLRMTALDELPAFLSVLKGEMSIVGPRAPLPLEVNHYSEEQRKRLEAKPGLTGYWQTFGRERGISDLNQIIEMDLEYLRKQSLWLDLKIIGKTFWMSLSSKGAY
ncbi:MAG TPA: sugar transferase [Desulfatiglandales bacterium]|nr:sugar transferase [Desulfatiglandales bacterium]